MLNRPLRAASLALLASCSAGPILAQPAGGSISVEAARAGEAAVPPAFVAATDEALAAHGFTILEDPGHSAYVAELVLHRVEVGTGTARVPAGRGAAYPGGAYGSVGVGAVLPLPTRNAALVPMQRIELQLRIRRRGEAAAIWTGAAMTVRSAGTRKGTDEAVAADLTTAMLRSYPAAPEGTIGVP